MIVDEERARERRRRCKKQGKDKEEETSHLPCVPAPEKTGSQLSLNLSVSRRTPPRPTLHMHNLSDEGSASAASSIGKRSASPTELLREDKEGEPALSKRPSLKRKQPAGDDTTTATTMLSLSPLSSMQD